MQKVYSDDLNLSSLICFANNAHLHFYISLSYRQSRSGATVRRSTRVARHGRQHYKQYLDSSDEEAAAVAASEHATRKRHHHHRPHTSQPDDARADRAPGRSSEPAASSVNAAPVPHAVRRVVRPAADDDDEEPTAPAPAAPHAIQSGGN